MKRRVVITGLGAVTALGEGWRSLWQAALEGRSGIGTAEFGTNGSSWTAAGGFVHGFIPEKYVTQRKSLKVMARDIQLAVASASLAIEDAGLKNTTTPSERRGIIVGSGVLNHEIEELASSVRNSLGPDGKLDLQKFGYEGMASLFPLWLLKYLPNMPACHISILFDFRGPNNTITTGPSAGLQAAGEACRMIERGAADIMLAGAAESKLNPVGYSEYQIQGVLARADGRNPHEAYCPFDARSNGFIIGEGAGFVVLEEYEHARKRHAPIYAEIKGFGCSAAGKIQIAMQKALSDAGVTTEDFDLVQASGIGLPQEDEREAAAIEAIFQNSNGKLSVTATKPMTGFTGFSAGTIDLIFASLSHRFGAVPPVLNLKNPRQNWKLHFVKEPLTKDISHVMTNMCGLGGQSVSMVTASVNGS